MRATASARAGLVVVPESQSDLAGAVTWWRLSGTASVEALTAALDGVVPVAVRGPSPEVAMRRAFEAAAHPDEWVEPLAGRRGLCLMAREFGDDGIPVFKPGPLVRYTDDGFEVVGAGREEAIVARYEAELGTLVPGDVGSLLSRVAHHCRAVALRDTGGIYFVPAATLPTWRAVAAAMGRVTANVVHELPALRTAEALAAVVDALTREVDVANDAVLAELDNMQTNPMGARALRTREERCRDLAEKLGVYERQLGLSLDALRETTATTAARVVAAGMTAASAETGVGR